MRDWIEAVSIYDKSDIRKASIAYHEIVTENFSLNVAPCHDVATANPMRDELGCILATDVFGWVEEEMAGWWTRPKLALESPLVSIARYENNAFWCREGEVHLCRENSYVDSIDLTNFEQRALTKAAIVVPVHLPFGQLGAISYNPLDKEVTDLSKIYSSSRIELEVLAKEYLSGYVSVINQDQISKVPKNPSLKKREVECLQWAGIGKTDEEISMILCISRSTVRFHLTNAAEKLEAQNRGQAILRAARLGYLKK